MNKYEKIKIFSDICEWLKCHAYEYTELEFLPDEDDPQSYINVEKMIKELKNDFGIITKEDKAKQFEPKQYALYENGNLISIYDSHKEAKKAKYFQQKEADADMLDIDYTIKPYK